MNTSIWGTVAKLYHTVEIIVYKDYLYGNLYQMPILYVEIDI